MPAASDLPPYQRNALAPSLIVAAYLFVSPLLVAGEWPLVTRFVVEIFAVIVGWYAFQGKQWWWLPIMAVIAVLWNPFWPLELGTEFFTAAAPIAAVTFLVAGVLIKTPRVVTPS